MKYRRLGKTDLRVSVIGMGTWQFGGEWGKTFEQNEVDAMFRRARELGINFIDTAECYGDHLSESLIGLSIQHDRADWVVATKFGHKYHGFMNRSEPRSAPEVMRQLEDSLRALRTDYIDLYQYHSVRNSEYDDEAMREALWRAVKAGIVRHLGASISPPDNIHQVEEAEGARVEAIQVVYNRLDRTAEQGVLPACQRLNLGVLARVPLASGYLTGKYRPGAVFQQGDVRAGQDREKIDARLREVEEIRQREVPAGMDMAQWALGWCLQHPAVTAAIPGCKNVAQVEANARGADGPLVSDSHPMAWP